MDTIEKMTFRETKWMTAVLSRLVHQSMPPPCQQEPPPPPQRQIAGDISRRTHQNMGRLLLHPINQSTAVQNLQGIGTEGPEAEVAPHNTAKNRK